ncbi:MAG: hypothetical protein FWH35_01120 [Treponema sp.]|nr:hypothetical protein [Treponema sp.]
MTIKTRYILIFMVLTILTAIALSTCFTSYSGGTGTLVVNIGSDYSRVAFEPAEIKAFTHTITLTGPGETQTQELKGEGFVTFELIPGTWNIEVRAKGDRPEVYKDDGDYADAKFPSTMLRAMGWDTVEVKSGQNSPKTIPMKTATEVINFNQLKTAIDLAEEVKEEIILISSDIYLEYGINIGADFNITFLADKAVTVAIDKENISPLTFMISLNNSKLTLGRKGMRGKLIIDGSGIISTIIQVYDGKLIMNDEVIIQKGPFGAVSVSGSGRSAQGIFTMNGGTISENLNNFGNGGGVFVDENGIFTMNGGEINDNEARDGGGGVWVEDGGQFAMNGGTISGNTDNNNGGGGVHVADGGTFKMSEGTISGNNASAGGGVCVDGGGIFKMSAGTISANEATICGGGVFVGFNDYTLGYGSFSKTGGTIYGNENGIDKNLMNIVTSGDNYSPKAYGHTVYLEGSYDYSSSIFTANRKILNSTAGPEINLDANAKIPWTTIE